MLKHPKTLQLTTANMMQRTVITLIAICIVTASGNILNPTNGNYTICNYATDIIDPARPTHNIPLLIYYPCDHLNKYPYMVFGHAAESQDTWYDYIWQSMVPQGYICIFLGSYEYVSEQENFARDQRYTNDWVIDQCSKDPNCPLYQIVIDKSIVSGMSMGGGASMLSGSNYPLGQTFNHTFDAIMTLSGCGGETTHKAMGMDAVPTIVMSGSHDCLCPATEYADKYYNNIPDTTCKYLAVITNGTHCHFGQEGYVKDDACELIEESGCNGKPYNHIPEDTQHQIVVNYYSLFMYATLYENNSKASMDAVSQQLTKDANDNVMYNVSINCN